MHWREVAADTLCLLDDGPQLPATLIENDALDVEETSRSSIAITASSAESPTTRATRLSDHLPAKRRSADRRRLDDQRQQLVQQAYDYYTQPAPEGAPVGGMPWFIVDEQPGAAEGTARVEGPRASEGALCLARRAHCRPPRPFLRGKAVGAWPRGDGVYNKQG